MMDTTSNSRLKNIKSNVQLLYTYIMHNNLLSNTSTFGHWRKTIV